jgi:uncharacterized membrane-anchored protein
MKINRLVLTVFAPILLVVGTLGFLLPASMALTSGATPYNVFHLVFGCVGLACVASKQPLAIKGFNVGFGAIDLYQAVASFADLWPRSLFQWKAADDVLHVLVGAALVGVGLFADRVSARADAR